MYYGNVADFNGQNFNTEINNCLNYLQITVNLVGMD